MAKRIAFEGKALGLFLVGLAALLIVPFTPWLHFGVNFFLPDEVSLVYLFARGFWIDLVLYLAGVGAAAITIILAKRPLFFLGALPAVFPTFVLVSTLSIFLSGYSMDNIQGLTPGVLLALLGSALLEASYFYYRKESRKAKSGFDLERPEKEAVGLQLS